MHLWLKDDDGLLRPSNQPRCTALDLFDGMDPRDPAGNGHEVDVYALMAVALMQNIYRPKATTRYELDADTIDMLRRQRVKIMPPLTEERIAMAAKLSAEHNLTFNEATLKAKWPTEPVIQKEFKDGPEPMFRGIPIRVLAP